MITFTGFFMGLRLKLKRLQLVRHEDMIVRLTNKFFRIKFFIATFFRLLALI
jgi:hypothetical protein